MSKSRSPEGFKNNHPAAPFVQLAAADSPYDVSAGEVVQVASDVVTINFPPARRGGEQITAILGNAAVNNVTLQPQADEFLGGAVGAPSVISADGTYILEAVRRESDGVYGWLVIGTF